MAEMLWHAFMSNHLSGTGGLNEELRVGIHVHVVLGTVVKPVSFVSMSASM